MPPAAGFVGKLQLFHAVAGDPALIALFFLGGALSFVYVFQVYQYEFWRGERNEPRSGVAPAGGHRPCSRWSRWRRACGPNPFSGSAATPPAVLQAVAP